MEKKQDQLDQEVGKIVRHIFDTVPPARHKQPPTLCPRCDSDDVLVFIGTGSPVCKCSCGRCRYTWQEVNRRRL